MDKFKHILAASAIAGAIGTAFAAGSAQAAILGGGIIAATPEASALIEPVQYRFGSYNYCWYPDGWRGPGWYWCGYAYRAGFGWGGPVGWNGWRVVRDHDRDEFRFRDHDRDDFRFRDHDRDRFRDHDHDRDHDRR